MAKFVGGKGRQAGGARRTLGARRVRGGGARRFNENRIER